MTEQDIELAAKWVDHIFLIGIVAPGGVKRQLRNKFIDGLRSGQEPPNIVDILKAKDPEELGELLNKVVKEQQEENEHPSTFRYPRLSSKD